MNPSPSLAVAVAILAVEKPSLRRARRSVDYHGSLAHGRNSIYGYCRIRSDSLSIKLFGEISGSLIAIAAIVKGGIKKMAGEKEGGESEREGFSGWLGSAAKLVRASGPPGKWLLREIKTTASYHQYKELHHVLHSLRKIPHHSPEMLCDPALAVEICTSFQSLMGAILEKRDQELHCCIKVLLKSSDGDRVGTIGRSEPYDHRPQENDAEAAHLVERNSVWCCLLGRNDGKFEWPVFSCFACGDLQAHPLDFKCDREHWQQFYRSTLVFPLRYIKDEVNSSFVTFGFLAFDSPLANAFGDLPDIFRYRERWHVYHQRLQKRAVFHVGAVFADTLSVLMRRAFEQNTAEGAANGGE